MSFHKKKLINDPNASKLIRGGNLRKRFGSEKETWAKSLTSDLAEGFVICIVGPNLSLSGSTTQGLKQERGHEGPIDALLSIIKRSENAYGEENGHVSKFEIATDEQPRVKKWVFDKICQFWKNWKSKLKKTHYDPFHTTRERLQYRPDRVDPVQWVLLIEFWGTKDGMERSKRNAQNRALQTMNHTAGTKSFARIREEEQSSTVAIDNSSEFQIV
ncbi:hypothetical protein MRB53_013775 [Persea americana]|uniref:Uncharacterized protein n=1 Tax=Persea americana TaxID=3435 RepID=A0ACC2K8W8_PERAE|nr:hypothetical protein MRB53_013775 [Persea americana]